MSWNFNNSLGGGYSGNGPNTLSGFSSFSPSVHQNSTTFTPSVSHSVSNAHHTFGVGATVTQQVSPSTTLSAGVKRHGKSTTFTAGAKINF